VSIFVRIREYSEAVLAGKMPACRKHRQACERFLRDCLVAGTEAFPYVFDGGKAERFFRWVRLFKHRKGVLTGQPIEPSPIHEFLFGQLYGWVHKDTGYRRFTKCYWQVARKNTKSQWLALVSTYELIAFSDRGECMEIYCAATKREQAAIVYEEALGILRNCDLLKGKWHDKYGRIVHKKSGSYMRALSKEDRKTGDGLNPQAGVIDEYHAHETSEIYDILDSGQGARSEPLLVIITTAGFDLEVPCYRVEYDLVSKILDPSVDVNIDSYLALVNELDTNDGTEEIEINGQAIPPGGLIDDISDRTAWEKANPIVCSYPEGLAYLEKKYEEAANSPEKLRNLLTKHMNVWVNQRDAGYMNMAKWNACKSEIPDLKGVSCYAGFDLSAKIDMTSLVFEFPIDERYIVLCRSFMPEARLAERMKTDRVPYDLWADEGWLIVTRGEAVDYRFVKDYALRWEKELGAYIEEFCFDPWGATQISADLLDEGRSTVDIVQGIKTLSEPTKNFREMVYEGRVVHEGNPLYNWAMSNAIADSVDRNDNILISKKKSRQRIDPVAATMNAHTRAMQVGASNSTKIFFV